MFIIIGLAAVVTVPHLENLGMLRKNSQDFNERIRQPGVKFRALTFTTSTLLVESLYSIVFGSLMKDGEEPPAST